MSTSGYDCVSSSEPSTSSLGSSSNGYGGKTDFSEHRDDATDVPNYEILISSARRRRMKKQMPSSTQRNRAGQKRKSCQTKKFKLAKNYGKALSDEIPIGFGIKTKTPKVHIQSEIRPRVITSVQPEAFKPIQNLPCVYLNNKEYDPACRESPVNVESCRYSISDIDCNHLYSNNFLNARIQSTSPSCSDECYGTASDNVPEEHIISDDDQTDFINATNKIYENLSMGPITSSTMPKVSDLKSLPPTLPPDAHIEDEASIYGRLTALLFMDARNDRSKHQKMREVQQEMKDLFQLPLVLDVHSHDGIAFNRNCALLGNIVTYSLRQTRTRSPEEYSVQVKKVHKLLYGFKKRNAFLSGVGRFVQRIFGTV